jgi:hypothetical protein
LVLFANYKKTKIIAIGILFILFFTTWYLMEDQKVTYSEVHAKQFSFKTSEEMIEFSELIVLGRAMASENFVNYDKDGFTDDAYTITQFKIDSILQEDKKTNLKAGDIIKVAEPTYIVDKGISPGKIHFSINNYQNMNDTDKYLLLLVPDVKYQDLYVISGVNEGKHNIERIEADKEKEGVPQEDKNKKFKEELMSRFNIKPSM